MSKCGKGWILGCSHDQGRRQCKQSDGVQVFEITADQEYSKLFEELRGSPANPDAPLNADYIRVRVPCRHDKKSCVTLDAEQAEKIVGEHHYWLLSHAKTEARDWKPGTKSFKFISTLSQALRFLNDETLEPESKMLDINGDQVEIRVYPGDYYSLVIDLPPARNCSFSRGPRIKDEINKPDDESKIPGAQKGDYETYDVNITHEPGDKPLGKGVKARLQPLFSLLSEGERSYYRYGLKYNPQTLKYEKVKSELGPLSQFLQDAPVALFYKGQPVRLSSLESVFAAIQLVKLLLFNLSQLAQSTAKVGAFVDMKASFLTGSLAVLWGLAEEALDCKVDRYLAIGSNLEIVNLDLELGFGIKSAFVKAYVYAKLSGKGKLESACKFPLAADVRNTGAFKVTISATPRIGGRVELGQIASAEALGEMTFEANAELNLKYSNAKDYLLECELKMGALTFKVELRGGDYIISDFEKEATKKISSTVRLPSDENAPERDKDVGSAAFEQYIREYVKKSRNGELDTRLRVFYDGIIWRAEYDDAKVAGLIVKAMQQALGEEYGLLEFTERNAENILRELGSMAGSRRFADDDGDIRMLDFTDLLGLTESGFHGAIPELSPVSMLDYEFSHPPRGPVIHATGTDPYAPRLSEEAATRYRAYMARAAAYRRKYGENNRDQFFNMLANYRCPRKIFERRLQAGDRDGTLAADICAKCHG